MQHIVMQVMLCEKYTTPFRFFATRLGEINVHPPGEEVLGVPIALTMSQQDEGRLWGVHGSMVPQVHQACPTAPLPVLHRFHHWAPNA